MVNISIILLYLLLEAALLQQLVCLIQNKQSDAGGGQHAQLNELLYTTCERNQEGVYRTAYRQTGKVSIHIPPGSYQESPQLYGTSSVGVCPGSQVCPR